MKKTTMPDWCVAVKKAMIDHDDMTVTELAKETGFSRSHTLIRERVASMYELTYVYNLDEMLKLYDLIMMQRDIEYAKSQEDRRGDT